MTDETGRQVIQAAIEGRWEDLRADFHSILMRSDVDATLRTIRSGIGPERDTDFMSFALEASCMLRVDDGTPSSGALFAMSFVTSDGSGLSEGEIETIGSILGCVTDDRPVVMMPRVYSPSDIASLSIVKCADLSYEFRDAWLCGKAPDVDDLPYPTYEGDLRQARTGVLLGARISDYKGGIGYLGGEATETTVALFSAEVREAIPRIVHVGFPLWLPKAMKDVLVVDAVVATISGIIASSISTVIVVGIGDTASVALLGPDGVPYALRRLPSWTEPDGLAMRITDMVAEIAPALERLVRHPGSLGRTN